MFASRARSFSWQAPVLLTVAVCVGGGYLFRRLYRALRGHDGLGQGDVKFAAAAALWVGLEGIPGLLLAAVASALASLLILRAQGYDLHGRLEISFGPHLALDQGFAIGDFIRSALASQLITIRGDPTTMRSYLYAADLAVWLWTILSRATPLRPYNVGSDQAISIGALAEEVTSVLCPGLPVRIASSLQPGAAPSQYVPATQRSTEELGLRQTIFLRDAIRRTAEWHGWRTDSSLPREGALH